MLDIIVTAYAVNPYKGSEDGTAWNWVFQLSKYHRIHLITRENNLPHIERYKEEHPFPHQDNLICYGFDLPYYLRWWKRGGFGALPYFYLWSKSLPGFIRKQKIEGDIVHALNFHNNWLPSFLWKLDKPFVWGPIGHHDPIPSSFLKAVYGTKSWLGDQAKWKMKQFFWRLSPALKKCAAKADLMLGVNSSSLSYLKGDKRTKFVMPAIGCKWIPRQETLKGEVFEVLSIGRFVPLKGFDLTIKSFGAFYHSLPKEDRNRVRLTLIGKGPKKERILNWIEEEKLGESVRLLDWMPQADLFDLYKKASAFLFPSHEGAGMVVPEALAYGLPIICLDNHGPGESSGPAGISIPAKEYQQTIQQLSQALQKIYTDPNYQQRLSDSAREHYEYYFEWSGKGSWLAEQYQHILKGESLESFSHFQQTLGDEAKNRSYTFTE